MNHTTRGGFVCLTGTIIHAGASGADAFWKLNMTTTTLIQALRADARAKLELVHTLDDLYKAASVLTEAIALIRTAPEDRPYVSPDEDPARRLAGDLLMLETARADLVARLDAHGRALEAGLFGAHQAADQT